LKLVDVYPYRIQKPYEKAYKIVKGKNRYR
jgi:hypothetical protein